MDSNILSIALSITPPTWDPILFSIPKFITEMDPPLRTIFVKIEKATMKVMRATTEYISGLSAVPPIQLANRCSTPSIIKGIALPMLFIALRAARLNICLGDNS